MKIIFIFLMCLSFFGCSKNQKKATIINILNKNEKKWKYDRRIIYFFIRNY